MKLDIIHISQEFISDATELIQNKMEKNRAKQISMHNKNPVLYAPCNPYMPLSDIRYSIFGIKILDEKEVSKIEWIAILVTCKIVLSYQEIMDILAKNTQLRGKHRQQAHQLIGSDLNLKNASYHQTMTEIEKIAGSDFSERVEPFVKRIKLHEEPSKISKREFLKNLMYLGNNKIIYHALDYLAAKSIGIETIASRFDTKQDNCSRENKNKSDDQKIHFNINQYEWLLMWVSFANSSQYELIDWNKKDPLRCSVVAARFQDSGDYQFNNAAFLNRGSNSLYALLNTKKKQF